MLESGVWAAKSSLPAEIFAERFGELMSKYLKPPSLSLEVDAGAAVRLRELAVMLMESSSSTDRAKRRDGSISVALNIPPNGRVCTWM